MPIFIEPFLTRYVDDMNGDTFLDIGANEGGWSIYAAGVFKTVLAFEPIAETHALLRSHVSPYPHVRAIPVALWRETTMLQMEVYKEDNGYANVKMPGYVNPIDNPPRPIKEVDVIAVALDDMTPSMFGKIDLVKIDTEGGEWMILQGGEHLLLHHRPRMVIECHTRENAECIKRWLQGHAWPFTTYPNLDEVESYSPFHHHHWIIAMEGA